MKNESGFLTEIKQDLVANGWNNAKLSTALRLLLLDLGVQLLLHYRLQVSLMKFPVIGKLLARLISYLSQILTGCQISSTAHIEGGVSFPHPNGIVIGRDVIVKSGTAIYQQVTLGADKEGCYPEIGLSVTIFAGAKIIGGIQVGDGAVVGANAVVITDVVARTVVAGIPAKVINR